MRLVLPTLESLPSYVDALKRGWAPDNVRGEAAAREQLILIESDPEAFVSSLVDKEAKGAPITLSDGSTLPRLPGYQLWMWDGEFCGNIGFRWRPGTETLPPTCLGHIGYGVVPWKRGRGYATAALRDLLPEARAAGLRFIEITTDLDNTPSQRVVLANGGVLVEEFIKPGELGGTPGLRYRIRLT